MLLLADAENLPDDKIKEMLEIMRSQKSEMPYPLMVLIILLSRKE